MIFVATLPIIDMKLYRCWTCGMVLTISTQKCLRNHAGHRFSNTEYIKFHEYPKVWLWRLQAWLKR